MPLRLWVAPSIVARCTIVIRRSLMTSYWHCSKAAGYFFSRKPMVKNKTTHDGVP